MSTSEPMPPALPPLYEAEDGLGDPGSLRLGVAGDLRWAVVDLSAPVERLRRRLDLAPVPAIALGRAMAAAVLLLRFSTKNPGRLRLELRGNGPMGQVAVDVDAGGLVRGRVETPRFGFDDGALDVGRAVGEGLLRVIQEQPGRDPWISQVALVSGEVGEDLVHFLHQSQQVRSAALLGVLPSPEGVLAAGGLLVEALPGAADEQVTALERQIADLGSVSEHLAKGGAAGLADAVLLPFQPEELERHEIRYGCRCSRQSLVERLATLPPEDIAHIVDEEGACDLVCAFCDGQIRVTVDELGVQN